MRISRIGLALAALAAGPACAPVRPLVERAPSPARPVEAPAAFEAPAAPGLAAKCGRIRRIVVHKGERSLVALCNGGARRSFPVALGRAPLGPKRAQGDSRTPEGRYRVAEEPRSSRFHLFISIDYPSPEDARDALEGGVIDRETFRSITSAVARGALPPQHTALGGRIGLHGEGAAWRGWSREVDWTLGCIALRDEDIEFLAERVSTGTEVWIRP